MCEMGGIGSGRRRTNLAQKKPSRKLSVISPFGSAATTRSSTANSPAILAPIVVEAPTFSVKNSHTCNDDEKNLAPPANPVIVWQDIFGMLPASVTDKEKEKKGPKGIEYLVDYYKKELAKISKCKHDSKSVSGIKTSTIGNIPPNFWVYAPDPVIFNSSGS
jgi:hypothetical protein